MLRTTGRISRHGDSNRIFGFIGTIKMSIQFAWIAADTFTGFHVLLRVISTIPPLVNPSQVNFSCIDLRSFSSTFLRTKNITLTRD